MTKNRKEPTCEDCWVKLGESTTLLQLYRQALERIADNKDWIIDYPGGTILEAKERYARSILEGSDDPS